VSLPISVRFCKRCICVSSCPGSVCVCADGEFCSIEESVQADVNLLKSSPLVREGLKGNIFGVVFDIGTGKLTIVA
jgi:carbonic anhydrase